MTKHIFVPLNSYDQSQSMEIMNPPTNIARLHFLKAGGLILLISQDAFKKQVCKETILKNSRLKISNLLLNRLNILRIYVQN